VWSRQMGHAFIATREMREDVPARWIGQRRERAIQCLRRIFNHLVNYLIDRFSTRKSFLEIFLMGPSAVSADTPPKIQHAFQSLEFAVALPPMAVTVHRDLVSLARSLAVLVRRRLIFIEGSIDWELQWVVFEPNAEPLWARVNRASPA
jgi:hypothetical protein